MAKKKIEAGTIVIRMSDDGSYKIVEQSAKKAGKAFNTVGLNAQSADRAMKGVSRQSSNATKNFSKMAQGIGGFLVPAYATLAAQLFAIDAAFRFLKDAADFRVLKEGQAAFAATTGMAIQSLAKDLMSATDAQITFKEASQAAAIGLAAGLSPTQLKELGAAAKTVSIALGRDVTDSFNRLVRGVTKAEPELLDELGIVLRLEEASIKYAAALGLNKNQLTTFQKSQAVTVEVLGQAESKFGAINEIMDPTTNALNKLGVAFDELLNKARPTIAFIAEFFSEVLTKNIAASTSAMMLFLGGIAGSLMPQIPTFDTGKAGAQAAGGITEILGDPKNKAQANRLERLSMGTYTKNDLKTLKKALVSQRSTLLEHNKMVEADRMFHLNQLKIMDLQYEAQQKAGVKRIAANWRLQLALMTQEYGKFMGGLAFLGRGLVGLARIAGWVGIAVIAIQSLTTVFDRYFTKHSPNLEKFNKRLDDSTSSIDGVTQELEKMAQVQERGLLKTLDQQIIQLGQAFQSADLTNRLIDYRVFTQGKDLNPEKYKEFTDRLKEQLSVMARMDPVLQQYVDKLEKGEELTVKDVQNINKISSSHQSNTQAVKSYNEAQSALVKLNNNIINQLPKLKYSENVIELEKQVEAMTQLADKGDEYVEKMLRAQSALTYILALQEEQIRIDKARLGVSLEVAENSFGTKAQRDAQNYQKVMTAVLKLAEARNELADAENTLATQTLNSQQRIAATNRIALAKGNIEILKQQIRVAKAQASELFSWYTSTLDSITSNLGSSIGAALRGDENAFKNIGEELTKSVTDGIGKALSERMMEDLLGGTAFDPNKIIKEIYVDEAGALQVGMNTAADKIEKAIRDGADYHNSKIILAFKLKTQADIEAEKIAQSIAQGKRDKIRQDVETYAQLEKQKLGSEAHLNTILDLDQTRSRYSGNAKLYDVPRMGANWDGSPRAYTETLSAADYDAEVQEHRDIVAKNKEEMAGLTATVATSETDLQALDMQIKMSTATIANLNTVLSQLPGMPSTGGTGTGGGTTTTTKNGITRIDPNTKLAGTETTSERFSESVDTFKGVSTKFLGGASMLLGAAGKSEEAAKLMEIAAKIQMAAMIYQGANSFFTGFGSGGLMGGLKGLFGVRQGGIASAPGYRSYSDGGTATGPSSGYLAELHGTEAVVPLPNGRSIPVEMQGKSGGTNNISVNVNMANGETTMTSDRGGEMGLIIAAAVKEVIADEQRAGGLLSGN